MDNLELQEWQKHLSDDNTVILDVRTPEENEESKIPNSILLNIQETDHFAEKVKEFDKDKKYMVYCRSGRRSESACKLMEELGFKDLHNLKGGIIEWSKYYETE